jgi:hypothetical protein
LSALLNPALGGKEYSGHVDKAANELLWTHMDIVDYLAIAFLIASMLVAGAMVFQRRQSS